MPGPKNRGKEAKDEYYFSSQKFKKSIAEALQDMQYLLSRGYTEKNALSLVGNRYKLASRQQKALQGMSASSQQILNRQAKEISFKDLNNGTLYLDGFNLIILLESALSQAYLFKGLDGCYRDLSSVHGHYKSVLQTPVVLDLLTDFHEEASLYKLVCILDKQVSNSGRLKTKLETLAQEKKLNWEIQCVEQADKIIANSNECIATSDGIILDNAKKWFNLGKYIIEHKINEPLIF